MYYAHLKIGTCQPFIANTTIVCFSFGAFSSKILAIFNFEDPFSLETTSIFLKKIGYDRHKIIVTF